MAASPALGARGAGPSFLRPRWERLTGPTRLGGVDLARGLAVIGMLGAHLLWTSPFEWSDPGTWTDVVNGRSSILFATLAGVSVGLMTGGQNPLPRPEMRLAQARLGVRAAILWLIGILLIATLVPVLIILPAYAIIFALVIPLVRVPRRILFVLAGGLALVMPWVQAWLDGFAFWETGTGMAVYLVTGWAYPFPLWVSFVITGLALARSDLRRLQVQLTLVTLGTALSVLGYALASVPTDGASQLVAEVWTAEAHSSGLWETIGSGGFALAVLGTCLLICRTPVGAVFLPLRATGAMPLTAYTAQLVAWAIVAGIVLGDTSDLGGFRALAPFVPMSVAIVLGCTAWALLIGRGPLEGLLDRLARKAFPGTR